MVVVLDRNNKLRVHSHQKYLSQGHRMKEMIHHNRPWERRWQNRPTVFGPIGSKPLGVQDRNLSRTKIYEGV